MGRELFSTPSPRILHLSLLPYQHAGGQRCHRRHHHHHQRHHHHLLLHCYHQSGAAVIVSILVALTVFVAEFLLRTEAEKVDQSRQRQRQTERQRFAPSREVILSNNSWDSALSQVNATDTTLKYWCTYDWPDTSSCITPDVTLSTRIHLPNLQNQLYSPHIRLYPTHMAWAHEGRKGRSHEARRASS